MGLIREAGLLVTGVIDTDRGQLQFIACGVIKTTTKYPFSHRLNEIFEGINEVVQVHGPAVAAVEDVFLAANPRSALKLGHARGAAVVAAMQNGLAVFDYSARAVKQAVAGYGQADKKQVQHMVRVLLSSVRITQLGCCRCLGCGYLPCESIYYLKAYDRHLDRESLCKRF